MARYTVHLPQDGASDNENAARAVFVRDGFAFGAATFGPFWLAANRAWIAAGLVLSAYLALGVAVMALAVPAPARLLAFAIAGVLLGFEAASLLRWSLQLRGFNDAGLVSGTTLEDAERRFFEQRVPIEPAPAPAPPAAHAPSLRPAPGVIGLFPGGSTR